MALEREWIGSPNYSYGIDVHLLVAHCTEGSTTYQNLGNYFKGNVGASSNVGIDNVMDNRIGEYVLDTYKAWCQCNANGTCLSAEQCGPSGMSQNWTRDYWLNSQGILLHNTAKWFAEEASQHNLPIVKLTASQAQGGYKGICGHYDLGSWGTGHYDPGSGYPWDKVIQWAKEYAGEKPAPEPTPPETGGMEMGIYGTGNITPANPRWLCTFPRSGPDRMTVFADANADNPVIIQHAIHYGGRWAQQNTVTLSTANPWTLMFSADDVDGVSITLRDGNQAAISVYSLP
jgi:hypothetical protein